MSCQHCVSLWVTPPKLRLGRPYDAHPDAPDRCCESPCDCVMGLGRSSLGGGGRDDLNRRFLHCQSALQASMGEGLLVFLQGCRAERALASLEPLFLSRLWVASSVHRSAMKPRRNCR